MRVRNKEIKKQRKREEERIKAEIKQAKAAKAAPQQRTPARTRSRKAATPPAS